MARAQWLAILLRRLFRWLVSRWQNKVLVRCHLHQVLVIHLTERIRRCECSFISLQHEPCIGNNGSCLESAFFHATDALLANSSQWWKLGFCVIRNTAHTVCGNRLISLCFPDLWLVSYGNVSGAAQNEPGGVIDMGRYNPRTSMLSKLT